jgi:uncharacterized membrane protein YfcA
MNPITGLLTALAALTVAYVGAWTRLVRGIRRERAPRPSPATERGLPTPVQVGVGAVTNFFDTLGIGSFATTTAIFRALRLVPDRVIPGTLNVGHTLPTVAQAFIYTSIIPVDVLTLVSMIAAAVLGAWLGAGVVARWPKYKVQTGMGLALIAAALLMVAKQYGWPTPPPGHPALGVRGIALLIAVAGNFMLGALMTLGIGLYAPCMILVSFLGMSEATAFPIMMGSCAFLMPVGSLRFIRERCYSLRASLGLAIGGIPGVLLAAYIVKRLPLVTVRWLVIVVVLYTAITMLYSAFSEERSASSAALEAEA